MDEFDVRTGRRYRLFEYHGDPAADRVIVVMGSAAETAHETVDWLRARGERVGVLKVRLYRPFARAAHLRRRCRRRRGRSPCSIARRSPARSASRSTWTC
jgi:pyruvate/2-oxoacid:ferredoxin oxidoreductase alpha subunit